MFYASHLRLHRAINELYRSVMKDISWDLYQHFLAVARHGGLAGAAEAMSVSSATMGRKILELETLAGEVYFLRSQAGYELNARGQALLTALLEMEGAARKVAATHGASTSFSRIRITAGTWNTLFMTDHIGLICTETDPFLIDFNVTEERARLAHREADLGIRAVQPDEPNLAAQKLPDVCYGIYRARNARVPESRWVAISEEQAVSAYLRWPHHNRKASIALTASRPTTMRDLIVSGAGYGVLPCICGEREAGLESVDLVPELGHEQWLVMNQDDRHRPDIRTVITRIVKLFKRHADIVSGGRG
ncbi:LysR family transcriptional regulator [Oryzibacter oryziterrae]|uniref:LysR family transcriptional regulator n=1 Tax=Oryzibacter oryziterrae TaxID=2766474 RepID=UPI001F43DCC5|nr:LysR family transcriptional regulator [Oryzibacter oryziterrae]